MKKNIFKLISGLIFALVANATFAQLAPPAPKGLASSSNPPAPAASAPQFVVLPVAQPVEVKGRNIEVIEFFWYGCPHCYDFDPTLQAWLSKQGKDVVFKRVPIAFREDFLPHSQMYYAFEAIGKKDAYTRKVMDAIHVEHRQLLKESEISEWVAKQGVDVNAFMTAYKSFSVVTKAKAANKIGESYRIDGVPTVAIDGKYLTSPSIAGGKNNAIEAMDFLIAKARREKK